MGSVLDKATLREIAFYFYGLMLKTSKATLHITALSLSFCKYALLILYFNLPRINQKLPFKETIS